MRTALLALLLFTGCGKSPDTTDTDIVGGDTDVVGGDTDVVGGDTDVVVADTDIANPCDLCAADATCVPAGDAATCVCNDGFEGDGQTCSDIDECAADNGGCDPNALCENTTGSHTCSCTWAYQGDGATCSLWVDEDRRACEFTQAEHPSYTNIGRDVALCGGRYSPDDIETACHASWHVCKESEWTARYPLRTYRGAPTDPDTIGPTIGTLASWGAAQADRCDGDVWEADRPRSDQLYSGVCHDPDATLSSYSGGSYNPWNGYKALFAEDGTTILTGVDAAGDTRNCCNWDASFAENTGDLVEGLAVYCCRD